MAAADPKTDPKKPDPTRPAALAPNYGKDGPTSAADQLDPAKADRSGPKEGGTSVAVTAPVPAAPDGEAPPLPPESPQHMPGAAGAAPTAEALAAAVPPPPGAAPPADPVEWADDLVARLAESGTGAGKLDVVRRAKLARFNDPAHAALPADHLDRHLTARQALDALNADPAVGEGTRAKARSLVAHGEVRPAPPTPHPADLLPPPPGRRPKADPKAG